MSAFEQAILKSDGVGLGGGGIEISPESLAVDDLLD